MDAVILYISSHRDAIIHELAPLLAQRGDLKEVDPIHYEADFDIMVRRVIADYVSLVLNMDPIEVFPVVEALNIKEFLKGVI